MKVWLYGGLPSSGRVRVPSGDFARCAAGIGAPLRLVVVVHRGDRGGVCAARKQQQDGEEGTHRLHHGAQQ